jgi:phosphoserine phosphatase
MPVVPTATVVDAAGVIERLAKSLETCGSSTPMAAFDADGTLWTNDVGDQLFDAALGAGFLRPAALPALRTLATRHGVCTDGFAGTLAQRLFAQFRLGRVPEHDISAMLVWCYAGVPHDELCEFARRAVRPVPNTPALEIWRWAESQGIHCIVVSASPGFAVRAGLDALGLAPAAVFAARARILAGTLHAALAQPLPYGARKAELAREFAGTSRWLAAFGDSAFDFELLSAAQWPVAVRARAGLRARFGEFSQGVLDLPGVPIG